MDRYLIRPTSMGLSTDQPELDISYGSASWPIKNSRVTQRSIASRWGYGTEDVDLKQSALLQPEVQRIILFEPTSGSRFTCYLTRDYVDSTANGSPDVIVGDLCVKRTDTDETWSYNTEMLTYTEKITNITTDTVTTAGENFTTDGVTAGDYFILDDDYDVNVQPDTAWGIIEEVGTTTLTLASTYSGTTGAFGSAKTAYVRRTYKVPANKRYSVAIVSSAAGTDYMCFTSGGDYVKSWSGSGTAGSLDETYAVNARYCIEFADRLFIADHGATRDPLGIAWSKNGDPNDWTDATAGVARLTDTSSWITGLGKAGGDLVVYKRDSIIFGTQTGQPYSPIVFSKERPGTGCIAPYSIVNVMGTNAFLGKDDFYIIDGEYPSSIGEKIRHKFFDIVGKTELEKVWGGENHKQNEIMWAANTDSGYYMFVWNYKYQEWYVYDFNDEITSIGKGAQ